MDEDVVEILRLLEHELDGLEGRTQVSGATAARLGRALWTVLRRRHELVDRLAALLNAGPSTTRGVAIVAELTADGVLGVSGERFEAGWRMQPYHGLREVLSDALPKSTGDVP
jgi:hypothetical protein